MKKVKVLFPFIGDTLGGSHISTLSLYEFLPDDYFEKKILIYQKGVLVDYLDSREIDYFLEESLFFADNFCFLKKTISILRANLSSLRYINTYSFDIVHTNDMRMHYSWVLATFISGRFHIWHQRSLSGQGVLLSIFSTRLITISKYCKKSFPVLLSRKAMVIDDPVYTFPNLKGLYHQTLCSEQKKILWVGNLRHQKRLDIAIKVISGMVNAGINVKLLVLGEEREPGYSQAKAEIDALGIEQHVEFCGVQKKIEPWLDAADVLLATAENEGLGRVLIEAMLLGTPVVASADGGHLEIVNHEETGLLVPLNDIQGYIVAISRIFNDRPKVEIMIRAACEYATNRFSPSAHADKVSSIYKDLMATRG